MTDGSSVALADVKQPVEDVVVILGIRNDFVCAIEDGGSFDIDEAAGAEERSICRCISGRVSVVHEALLARVGVPGARSTVGVIVFGFS